MRRGKDEKSYNKNSRLGSWGWWKSFGYDTRDIFEARDSSIIQANPKWQQSSQVKKPGPQGEHE